MFITTKWQSKTALLALCILSCNAPLQAFSATEQLGKLKDFVLDHPKESLIGAGVICIVSCLIVAIRAEDAERARKEEESRILHERFLAEQTAEQARIDGLSIEELLAEFVLPNIEKVQNMLSKVESARIIGLHRDLYEFPLSKNGKKALKKQLKFLCAQYRQDIDSWNLNFTLQQAIDAMNRRSEFDMEAKALFAPLLKQIDVIKTDVQALEKALQWQAKKIAKKEALQRKKELKEKKYSHTCGNGCYKHWQCYCAGCCGCSLGTARFFTSKQETRLTANEPVETHAIETKPAAPVEYECYDFNNPYHNIPGE